MRSSKRGQAGEYVGIVILIVLLVLFVLFNRLGSASSTAMQTQKTVRNYQTIYNLVSYAVIPRLSANLVSFDELYKWYVCYHNEGTDMNAGEVQLIQTVQNKFDLLFGEDRWKLELNEEVCIETDAVYLTRCYLNSDIEYEVMPFIFPIGCTETIEIREGVVYIRITP